MHRQFGAIPLDFHPEPPTYTHHDTTDRESSRTLRFSPSADLRNDDTAPYDDDTEPYISPSAYLHAPNQHHQHIITISTPDSDTECPREYQRGPRACAHPMDRPPQNPASWVQ